MEAAAKCTPESLAEMPRQSMASRKPPLSGCAPAGAKRGDLVPNRVEPRLVAVSVALLQRRLSYFRG